MDPVLVRNRITLLLVFVAIAGCLVVLLVWLRDESTTSTQGPSSSPNDVPPLDDVLPISEESYGAAATTAVDHATAYASYTPGESKDDYLADLQDGGDQHYQAALPDSALADNLYTLLSEAEAPMEGQVRIDGIDEVSSHSITFVVDLESVPETEGESTVDLGRFGFSLINVDDVWLVNLVTQDIH